MHVRDLRKKVKSVEAMQTKPDKNSEEGKSISDWNHQGSHQGNFVVVGDILAGTWKKCEIWSNMKKTEYLDGQSWGNFEK